MAMLVFVEVSSVSLVQRSVNSTGGATFGMVERKIPAIAALAASGDSDIPGVVDMQESVTVTLMECTCLLRKFYDTVRRIVYFVTSKPQHPLWKFPSKPRTPPKQLNF